MKKLALLLLAFLLLPAIKASAQSELPSDSVRYAPPADVKDFNGFLLDMGLMQLAPPQLKKFDFTLPDVSKDYRQLFGLNTDVIYTQGFAPGFSMPTHVWAMGTGSQFMQMGSFKLKNGLRINTYGDYNKDGYRVFNPSALPWERNNFRGAFEMKSANGNFGIRIEVQQGRNSPYFY